MFKKLTKFIVNQMDPCEELVPVESIADNEHFRPLYLLKKKRKPQTIFHRAPYYQRTGFTLHDVLLPGEDGESTEKSTWIIHSSNNSREQTSIYTWSLKSSKPQRRLSTRNPPRHTGASRPNFMPHSLQRFGFYLLPSPTLPPTCSNWLFSFTRAPDRITNA
uniref:Gasdermin pore forming domain-containing protein n=1 Tax=Catharus ustulatus TaxID=91951 RepID=A0A8C3URV9_CATUS